MFSWIRAKIFSRFISGKYTRGLILFHAGILIGFIIFHQPSQDRPGSTSALHEHSDVETTIWTCAMHPQIKMEKQGMCPICGMDLIPLQKSNAEIDDQAIEMSESALKLAEVQTTLVKRGDSFKELFLYGKIRPDEKLLKSQTAHISGRIEKLYINVTGEPVKEGQLIASIYSPELITTQKELLEAMTLSDKYPAILGAAREKLRNLKLTESQIKDIENSGTITSTFDIYSNTSGIVSSRKVNEGDYISKGSVLFDVMDLSEVWAVFDAYETDLPWISLGEKVEFTTQAIPGKTFEGKISFIDPVMDPLTRIARVRVNTVNSMMKLKPDMFINGVIHSGNTESDQQIIIPQSAVLWTGARSIVYIRLPGTEEPAFKMREITLGASMKDSYIVADGLEEGEEIVTNGTFSIDAAAQLNGKPSMMNSEGDIVSSSHQHGNMDMPGTEAAMKIEVTSDFKMQLNNVYDRYLVLKNAFVESDSKKVIQSAKEVLRSVSKVDMKLVSGDAYSRWMAISGHLEEGLKSITGSRDIEEQRVIFSGFNSSVYDAVKTFGLMGKTVYYQFCPMANDNSGAYWLSETEDIRNPYFGDAMLTCGETKEIFNY